MAVYVFRDRMDDNIRTVVQWILNIRAQECVVDDHHNPVLVRHGRDSANIHQAQCWIARAFDPDQFSVLWADQFRNIDFETRGKRYLDAMCGGHLSEIAMGPAIDVRNGYDMRPRCQGLQNGSCSCGA